MSWQSVLWIPKINAGISGWECRGTALRECDFWGEFQEELLEHWRLGRHRLVRGFSGREEYEQSKLEAMVAEYKEQVEQEFTIILVSLLGRVAEAKDAGILAATSAEEVCDLSAAKAELLRTIDTIKVMGGLEI